MSCGRIEHFEEYELKLQITPRQLARIRANPILQLLLDGPSVTRKLRTIYFDTPDHALRTKGFSLRVRRLGKQWIQTAKAAANITAGLSRRAESEISVATPEPCVTSVERTDLREGIESALQGAALKPVFETVVRRTTHQLVAPGGGKVELALDRGEIRSAHRRAKICEAEFELKSGDRRSVFDVAQKLMAGEPIRFSNGSKAELGYRTVAGATQDVPVPMFTASVRVARDDTAHGAFQSLVRRCGDLIAHNIQVVVQSDHPEGPHQLRVALRKLRCAVGAYQPIDGSKAVSRIDGDARKLSRLVGELRDADVLIGDIVDPVSARRPDDLGLQQLDALLRRHRERIRTRVRSALGESWVGAFQLRLLALAEDQQFCAKPGKRRDRKSNPSLNTLASSAIEASWSGAVTRAKRLNDLCIAERHELRKALRNLRYVMQFHAPLYPQKRIKRFVSKLKSLQCVFGYLNDVALAEKLPQICAEEAADDAEIQRASGHTIGWHEARAEHAWTEAKSRWQALKKTRRFWRS